jgi:hypothetical protein
MAIKLYNTEKKELIGIFKTNSLVGKYLFPLKGTTKSNSRISTTLKQNSRINNTIFPFPVAIRFCEDDLISEDYVISPGYPQPNFRNFK